MPRPRCESIERKRKQKSATSKVEAERAVPLIRPIDLVSLFLVRNCTRWVSATSSMTTLSALFGWIIQITLNLLVVCICYANRLTEWWAAHQQHLALLNDGVAWHGVALEPNTEYEILLNSSIWQSASAVNAWCGSGTGTVYTISTLANDNNYNNYCTQVLSVPFMSSLYYTLINSDINRNVAYLISLRVLFASGCPSNPSPFAW